ncbi:CotO family spore coat protein [Bacillus sp. B190/17]|uniref:CotO family spore coat protein n=1 Tax=Bacillus lumedeiriae TaxID=3058829 RepID=A0ABW8I8G3_9BACI
MKKTEEKREPLLYIHQPQFVYPEPVMQSTYRSKDELKETELAETETNQLETAQEEMDHVKDKQQKKEKNRKKKLYEAVKAEQPMIEEVQRQEKEVKKDLIKNEQLKEEEEETETETKQHVWRGMRPVKRFQEMEMDEKLQHLMSQFTTLPCIFECEEISHKGVLEEVTPEQIKVKTIQGEKVDIERKDLKRIRLLGPL